MCDKHKFQKDNFSLYYYKKLDIFLIFSNFSTNIKQTFKYILSKVTYGCFDVIKCYVDVIKGKNRLLNINLKYIYIHKIIFAIAYAHFHFLIQKII